MDYGMIGEIRLFVGKWAPIGWLFCEGQQIPQRQYSALWSVIAYQYGGSGEIFHLPNLAPLKETASGRQGDIVSTVRYVICHEGL